MSQREQQQIVCPRCGLPFRFTFIRAAADNALAQHLADTHGVTTTGTENNR